MSRLAIALLAALFLLPGLGSPKGSSHPDEAYYLGLGSEMAERGAFLTPTLDGVPLWYKPPLLFWAQRAAFAVLGRGLFAARLPAALAGVALALLAGALARRLHGAQAEAPAALLVASSLGILRFGRLAMMDVPMALAFGAAAFGALAAAEGRPRSLLWCGLGAGAASLLKGPVGALVVLVLASAYLAARAPRLLASRHAAAAALLGALVSLPWFVASLVRHGRAFWGFFVVEQNLDRFRHPWTLAGEATLLVGFLVFLLPWTPLAVAALPALRRPREPGVLLPAAWGGAVLAVFTVPALKWPHYGVAALPAAVLLAVRAPPPRWAALATAALLALAGAAAALALRFPLPTSAALACGGAAALLLAAAAAAARPRLASAAALTGLALSLLFGVAVPAVNLPPFPASALAAAGGRPIAVFGQPQGLLAFAAGRPLRRLWSLGRLEGALDAGLAVVLRRPDFEGAPAAARERAAVLASWPRLAPEPSARRLLEAWRQGELSALEEEMLLVAARTPEPSRAAPPVDSRQGKMLSCPGRAESR